MKRKITRVKPKAPRRPSGKKTGRRSGGLPPLRSGSIKRAVPTGPKIAPRSSVRKRFGGLDSKRPSIIGGGSRKPIQAKKRPAIKRVQSRPIHKPSVKGISKNKGGTIRPVRPRPSGSIVMPRRQGGRGMAIPGIPLPRVNPSSGQPRQRRHGNQGAQDQYAQQLAQLNRDLSVLQEEASFSDTRTEIDQIDARVVNMPNLLEDLRDRGYLFNAGLEADCNAIIDHWEGLRYQIDNTVAQQAQQLQMSITPLETQLSQVRNSSYGSANLSQIQARVNALRNEARSMERRISSNYADISNASAKFHSQLNMIDTILDTFEEASFELLEDESPIRAASATLNPDSRNEIEGILYLTDDRLIFERKETQVVKKILFIPTEKELVQEAIWQFEPKELEKATARKKGIFGGNQILEIVQKNGKAIEITLGRQSSEDWMRLITDFIFGRIDEHMTDGNTLNYSDLTGPITKATLVGLQAEVDQLQKQATLGFVKSTVEDLETEVGQLTRKLADNRAKGYAFEKDIEAEIATLTGQWASMREAIQTEANRQSERLVSQMQAVESSLANIMSYASNPESARPMVQELRSQMATAQAQVNAAEDAIEQIYDDFEVEVEAVDAHMDWVAWTLGALATASFRLSPVEGAVAAAKAEMVINADDRRNGIIYLTDKRVVFEEHKDRNKIKILDVLLNHLEDVDGQGEQGESFAEEHLTLTFGASASVRKALFILDGPDVEDWLQMLGRARGGDYHNDRAVEIDKDELSRLLEAPVECPACGSSFNQQLIKGQHEIQCEYCFTITRF